MLRLAPEGYFRFVKQTDMNLHMVEERLMLQYLIQTLTWMQNLLQNCQNMKSVRQQ